MEAGDSTHMRPCSTGMLVQKSRLIPGSTPPLPISACLLYVFCLLPLLTQCISVVSAYRVIHQNSGSGLKSVQKIEEKDLWWNRIALEM
jgi:hypothetical protein